jgi:uncharacterized protein HemX
MGVFLFPLATIELAFLAALARLLGGVNFSNTINLGAAIIALLLAVGTLIGVFYGVRYKSAADASSAAAAAHESNAHAERSRADRLETALAETNEILGQARVTIERLEALPNLVKVIEFMDATAQRIDERAKLRTEEADERAKQRLDLALNEVQGFVRGELQSHEEEAKSRHAELVNTIRGGSR